MVSPPLIKQQIVSMNEPCLIRSINSSFVNKVMSYWLLWWLLSIVVGRSSAMKRRSKSLDSVCVPHKREPTRYMLVIFSSASPSDFRI